jgi:hypothetical protein
MNLAYFDDDQLTILKDAIEWRYSRGWLNDAEKQKTLDVLNKVQGLIVQSQEKKIPKVSTFSCQRGKN